MTPEIPPEVWNVIEESQALLMALAVVEGTEGDAEGACERVRQCLGRRGPSETVEEHVIRAAMTVLTGSPPTEPVIGAPVPVEQHLVDTVGLAWVGWARGDLAGALQLLVKCGTVLDGRRHPSGMTLQSVRYWTEALRHLLTDNPAEAHRLWNRAIEVATIFGLPHTSMVRWTYAASFFQDAAEPFDP